MWETEQWGGGSVGELMGQARTRDICGKKGLKSDDGWTMWGQVWKRHGEGSEFEEAWGMCVETEDKGGKGGSVTSYAEQGETSGSRGTVCGP